MAGYRSLLALWLGGAGVMYFGYRDMLYPLSVTVEDHAATVTIEDSLYTVVLE